MIPDRPLKAADKAAVLTKIKKIKSLNPKLQEVSASKASRKEVLSEIAKAYGVSFDRLEALVKPR